MTVSVPGSLTYSYAGNGSTTAFSYPVKFLENADLVVVLEDEDGEQTVQTITTHYSVSGAGNSGGGTVTMVTAPATGETVHIYRSTAKKQVVDLTDNSRNPAQSVEDQLDRFAMAEQDINNVLGRAWLSKVGEAGGQIASGAAGETLVFDADGNVVPGADQSEIEAAQGYAEASAASATAAAASASAADATLDAVIQRDLGDFADDAAADAYATSEGITKIAGTKYFNTTSDILKRWDGSAWLAFDGMSQATYDPSGVGANAFDAGNHSFLQEDSGAVARSVQDKLWDIPSLKDFAAVGDGVNDDTDALQAALNSNRVVFAPRGLYRITRPLVIDPVRNRNAGFISWNVPSRYPDTSQSGGPTWSGDDEVIIQYDGPDSADMTSTSATSVAIGTGSKSFTTDTGKAYQAGDNIRITSDADPTVNWMHGAVTSYDSGTGALVVDVTSTGGSGTLSDWTLKVWTAVLAASPDAISIEPASSFANTIWGLELQNIIFDANDKADFGLYGVRVQALTGRNVVAINAREAGVCLNGTYSGHLIGVHCYLNWNRGFELGGSDQRWGWSTNDKINAFYLYDLRANANGRDQTFRQSDADLCQRGCGVFWGPHRGAAIYGVVSENNYGANIVFAPSGVGNRIQSIYTELGCKYAPDGAGSDAISQGHATDQLGIIFIGPSDGSGHGNGVFGSTLASDKIWLTGTTPSASRPETGFTIADFPLISGIIADWANYKIINCAAEATVSGTAPTGAITTIGGIQFAAGSQARLSAYAEGTFTPTLEGLSTAGTGWTYSVQSAAYTRIGRHVFVTGRIVLSAKSGDASGQIVLAGLPYTVRSGNNYQSAVSLRITSLTTSVVSVAGVCFNNNTRIGLNRRTVAGGSDGSMVLADLSDTTSIEFSAHYVAS